MKELHNKTADNNFDDSQNEKKNPFLKTAQNVNFHC